MSAQTEVLKLYMPGGGSLGLGGTDEVIDVDKLNQNSQKIDAFAKGWGVPAERNQQFYGLAAGRGVLTGMKRGDTYQESDGDKRLWRFDGLDWVVDRGLPGLVELTSATGTGATVVDGSVALSNASGNINIAIPFSNRFDHYVVEIVSDASAGDSGINGQLRAAGSAIATGYYGTYEELAVGIGRTKSDVSNAASFPIGRLAVNGGACQWHIFRPAKTVGMKQFQSQSIDGASYRREAAGYQNGAAALDGVIIMLGTPAISSGRIRVRAVI